ncbi:MAG: hypothetical protein ACOX62_07065 [Christensenellales bacterium]
MAWRIRLPRREPQISSLLSDGQTLYALDNEAQTLYIIEIQDANKCNSKIL